MNPLRRTLIHAGSLALVAAACATPTLAQQKVGSATISVVPSTSAVVLFVARALNAWFAVNVIEPWHWTPMFGQPGPSVEKIVKWF